MNHTLIKLSEKYWVLKAIQAVKSILRKCIVCKRFNSLLGDQLIAPLLADRLEPVTVAPFAAVGFDLGGPLFGKNIDNKQ